MDDAEAASNQGSASPAEAASDQGSAALTEVASYQGSAALAEAALDQGSAALVEGQQALPLPPSTPSTQLPMARSSPRRSTTQAAPISLPTPQSPEKPVDLSTVKSSPKSQSPKYAVGPPTEIFDKIYKSPKSPSTPIPSPTSQSPRKPAELSPIKSSPKSQSPKYAVGSPTEISDKIYKSLKSPSTPIPSPSSQSPRKPAELSPTKSSPKSQSPKYAVGSPTETSDKMYKSPKSPSPADHPDKEHRSPKAQRPAGHIGSKLENALLELQPNGKTITEKVEGFKGTVKELANELVGSNSNNLTTNIDKIANMSKLLTSEANALRQSIKYLTEDIARTKQELCYCKEENVNFPYHLFLIEMIINKIHMKCECFDLDYNNLVISAVFLGKPPIVLYDSSFGKIDNFSKLNVGKSTLFAMTYDKICSIKEFQIAMLLTKQPPCSTCVTRIAETHIDFTPEFIQLREELCKKWTEEQPKDNILCTTSTPLSKNMYYLSCCDGENRDSIGVIEVTIRMSFLGKEITTAFCASPKPKGTSFLLKEDHGMTMYSCHKVEMDEQGKILLDEGVMTKKATICTADHKRSESPQSQISSAVSRRTYECPPCCAPVASYEHEPTSKYDEIYTKMNVNELKIRVPKSSRVERIGRYDKIQELCSCESTPYNTGEQIQFELPRDPVSSQNNTYSSNLTYTLQGLDRQTDRKDRKTVNVTPTNCPIPVNMAKELHPQKDVFILKIGKKLETKDKKTDLEIELVTPKAPPCNTSLEGHNVAQQYSGGDISKNKILTLKGKGGKDKKGKGGKDKKGKGGKDKKGKGGKQKKKK